MVSAGLLTMGAGVAQAQSPTPAQCAANPAYPGCAAVPGTETGPTAVGASAPLGPGATVSLTVTDPDITPGEKDVVTASTPVTTRATATRGSVTANVKLPADFNRNANHTVTVIDVATGRVQAQKTFGVNASGSIVAPYQTGSNLPKTDLPKTGTDYVDPALRVGGALLVAGGAIVLVARRRKADVDAAVA